MFNALSLIAGFVLGQGSIFLAQTYLVHTNNLERVTDYGVAYSIFILMMLIVESGSVQYIARSVSLATSDVSEISKIYSNVVIYKLIIAFIIIVISTVGLFLWSNDFTKIFIIGLFPVIIFHAFSPSGVLDGLSISGYNGYLMMFQNLGISIILVLTSNSGDIFTSACLAFSISIIYIIITFALIKMLAKKYSGFAFKFKLVNFEKLKHTSINCFPLLFSMLPGQVFQRIQLLLSKSFLGDDITAYFIYVKQIISSISQLISFIKRIEYPKLVKNIENLNGIKLIKSGFHYQWYSFAFAILCFAGIHASLYINSIYNLYETDIVINILTFASILVLSEVFSSSSMYLLAGKAEYLAIAVIRTISVIIAIILIYSFDVSINHIIIAEFLCQLMIFSAGTIFILRRNRYV